MRSSWTVFHRTVPSINDDRLVEPVMDTWQGNLANTVKEQAKAPETEGFQAFFLLLQP
jgi:hypothetical protein